MTQRSTSPQLFSLRKAVAEDLSSILTLYAGARSYMAEKGNATQWGSAYPPRDLVEADIADGHLYLCLAHSNGQTEMAAVFYYNEGDDPTYRRIEGGAWLSDAPYGVIHRIAVADGFRGQGVASFCFQACLSRCGNLRIDTHENNLPMQKALQKNGFRRCGIIYTEEGDARIAFQKIKAEADPLCNTSKAVL